MLPFEHQQAFRDFETFFSTLYEDAEHFITELRFLSRQGTLTIPWLLDGDLSEDFKTIQALNDKGFNVYAVVQKISDEVGAKLTAGDYWHEYDANGEVIKDSKGRPKRFQATHNHHIEEVRAVFLEFDGDPRGKDHDDPRTLHQYLAESLPLTPHLVVQSSLDTKLHLYFKVEGVSLEEYPRIQKALARRYGSDPSVNNLARIMRVPGTKHVKDPSNPLPCKVLECNPHLPYSRDELVAELELETELREIAESASLYDGDLAHDASQWEHVCHYVASANEAGFKPDARHDVILSLAGTAARANIGLQQATEDIRQLVKPYFASAEIRERDLSGEIRRAITSAQQRLNQSHATQPKGIKSLRDMGIPIPPLPAPRLRHDHDVASLVDEVLEINERWLSKETFEAIQLAYPNAIMMLQSPLGTGKTTMAKALAKHSDDCLVMAPQIAVVEQLAKRKNFDTLCYKDLNPIDYSSFNTHPERRLAVTADSVHKLLKFAPEGEKLKPFNFVMLDEIDGLTRRITSRQLTETELTLDTLSYYASHAKTILAASAYIDDASVTLLKQLAPHRPIVLIKNNYQQDPQAYTYRLEVGQQKDHAGLVLKQLKEGKRIAAPVDTQKHAHVLSQLSKDSDIAKELEEEVRKLLPTKRILRVDSMTRGNDEVRAFIANPDEECKKYDLIIYTPVLNAGFNVEGGHGFCVTAFSCAKSVLPVDFMQLCARFRDVKHLDIICRENKAYKPVHSKAIEKQLLEIAKYESKGLDHDGRVTNNPRIRELTAISEACSNRQTNNFVPYLHGLLKSTGRGEVELSEEIIGIYGELAEAAKELRLKRTAQARALSHEEYQRYKDSQESDENTNYAVLLYELQNFYGTELEDKKELYRLAKRDNEGRIRRGINNLVLARADEAMLQGMRELELSGYRKLDVEAIPDVKLRTLRLASELNKKLLAIVGQTDLEWYPDPPYGVYGILGDAAFKNILDFATTKNRRRYQRLITFPTRAKLKDKTQARRWILKELRDRFGMKTERVKRADIVLEDENGKKYVASKGDVFYTFEMQEGDLAIQRYQCLQNRIKNMQEQQTTIGISIKKTNNPVFQEKPRHTRILQAREEAFFTETISVKKPGRTALSTPEILDHLERVEAPKKRKSKRSLERFRRPENNLSIFELEWLQSAATGDAMLADKLARYKHNPKLYTRSLRDLVPKVVYRHA